MQKELSSAFFEGSSETGVCVLTPLKEERLGRRLGRFDLGIKTHG